MKLKRIIEGFERDDHPSLSTEEKKEILGMISEYNNLGKALKREGSLPDVAKKLSKMAEAAQKITLSETDEWFDSQTVKKNMDGLKKASSEFNKLAKEAYIHEQRMTALYEDMGHILGRYFKIKDPIEEIVHLSDLEESKKKINEAGLSGEDKIPLSQVDNFKVDGSSGPYPPPKGQRASYNCEVIINGIPYDAEVSFLFNDNGKYSPDKSFVYNIEPS